MAKREVKSHYLDASEEHVLNEALMIPSVNIQVKDKKIRNRYLFQIKF